MNYFGTASITKIIIESSVIGQDNSMLVCSYVCILDESQHVILAEVTTLYIAAATVTCCKRDGVNNHCRIENLTRSISTNSSI